MHQFGFNFSQLYFSLPDVRGKVKMYWGKCIWLNNAGLNK